MSEPTPDATRANTDSITVAVIGGSGLGAALAGETVEKRHESLETPFGPPSDAILETTINGVRTLLLSRHGPGHKLNPTQVPYRANLFALKQLGATHVLASGAVGSLREEMKPRELVIPDQAIDKTFKRARTFYEKAAVHVELAEPFCPILRSLLVEAGAGDGGGGGGGLPKVHSGGTYVAMEGPAFSTRAESHMHRLWGGDLIGMTLMPEAILAKEAELPYAAVALVTDYDCWRQPPPPKEEETPAKHDPAILLKEIIGSLQEATSAAMTLIKRTIALMGERAEQLAGCPAPEALALAIWSDKKAIDPEEIEKLRPLWGRHFE